MSAEIFNISALGVGVHHFGERGRRRSDHRTKTRGSPAEGERGDQAITLCKIEGFRIYLCGRCRALVAICPRCDRGDLYCDEECSREQRALSLKAARRRYRESPRGRQVHAEGQVRYRAARRREMDQGLDPTGEVGRVELDVAGEIDTGSIAAAPGELDHAIEEEKEESEVPGEVDGRGPDGTDGVLVMSDQRGGVVALVDLDADVHNAAGMAAGQEPGGARGEAPEGAGGGAAPALAGDARHRCCVRCGLSHDGWIAAAHRREGGHERSPWRRRRAPDSS